MGGVEGRGGEIRCAGVGRRFSGEVDGSMEVCLLR